MDIKSFLLYLLIFGSHLTLMAQENTSLLCADGIDNDGDGLIDCDDPDCDSLPNEGCLTCGAGINFADVVYEYNSGCPAFATDLDAVLGVADYDGVPSDTNKFVFLGEGGILTVGFTNNLLTNSGDNLLDLWIFEVGPAVESSDIAIRPADPFTETQLINAGIQDFNSNGYYEFGTISGSTSGIDIDLIIPGYIASQLKFNAVEIRDVDDIPCTENTPGADIDAVCAIFSIETDCNGIIGGTSVIDDCGECVPLSELNYNLACLDCLGEPFGSAIIDSCGICLELSDPSFNTTCLDCDGVINGNSIIDTCGVCLPFDDPEFNASCTDCNGIIGGTSVIDDCGECVPLSDLNYNLDCLDCNGEPFGSSIIDSCGVCLTLDDPDFNASCIDCAGQIFGTATVDSCGVCLEISDLSFNTSCLDCDGIINGNAILDSCGLCIAKDDPDFNASCSDCAGQLFGTSILDTCGLCTELSNPFFNLSCLKEIYIPNIFSPNQDGINDVFRVFTTANTGAQISTYRIYSRWGELIHEANNFPINKISRMWNGDYRGKPMNDGVFVYYIEILYIDQTTSIFKGDLTLLR